MNESEIVKDFLIESYENLDRLDRELVDLEKNPKDKAALAGVFRTIHTIKGTCGFLRFTKLEKVAHAGENLLSRLRDGELTLNPERTTALLGMVDAIRALLAEIESTGQDGETDYPELRETLTRLQSPSAGDKQDGLGVAALPTSTPAESASKEKPGPSSIEISSTPCAPAEAESPKPLPPISAPQKKSGDSRRKPTRGKIGGLLVE